ncbi:MAG: hypothetical protein Q9210_002909 [Variospora velana]
MSLLTVLPVLSNTLVSSESLPKSTDPKNVTATNDGELECSFQPYRDLPRMRDCAIAMSHMPKSPALETFITGGQQGLPLDFDGLKCRVTISLDRPRAATQSSWLNINMAATQAMLGCLIFNGPSDRITLYQHRTGGSMLEGNIRITFGKPGRMEGPWVNKPNPTADAEDEQPAATS